VAELLYITNRDRNLSYTPCSVYQCKIW